jgi:hypothetical protein
VFAGRYEILGTLGRGGMGVVYRARDRQLDEVVALKLLRPEALAADPTLLERFKQELKLARRITHRNVLRTLVKSLPKDPASRWQSADEVFDALSAISARAGAA